MSQRIKIAQKDGKVSVEERTSAASIFERSVPGRTGFSLPAESADTAKKVDDAIPARFRRKSRAALPEVGELDVVRHFTHLSTRTLGVDTTFYPLGSCTMKYNPKINEDIAALPGNCHVHPHQPADTMQGLLKVYHDTAEILGKLTGLPGVSLQPAAGAHGEFTALLVMKAYFESRGEAHRNEVIIPDTAHGTNPASALRCGLEAVNIQSDSRGRVNIEELKSRLGPNTACMMITNPNTLGLFEDQIHEVAELIHAAGALIYLDGANFNAIVGRVRPADFGADMMHINVHKTFSIPHGGGGPGAGPICVRDFLAPFLPAPHIKFDGTSYSFDHNCPQSIGKVRSYFGNVNNVMRTYVYLRQLGEEGVRQIASYAVLNANYLLSLLAGAYDVPFGRRCMHEFVINATRQKNQGARAMDIAKKILDYGFHPPTTYFPLIVPEALMIEPTETESKETLELFAAAMLEIARLSAEDSSQVTAAPQSTPVTRMDELAAARQPVLSWPDSK
ncbi:MAG: aminomethyl-transferring glycine dehydrogenase subunit GcvPB [Candidatus Sumerlaeaceae bacterium]|nr:aminomethyl-transferring glycine dehydrogenase subunit GcvPB [Candidatus Sumerlaeaceae bacterium]